MPDETTTIEVSRDTWKQLNGMKQPGDSFDDVIQSQIDESGD